MAATTDNGTLTPSSAPNAVLRPWPMDGTRAWRTWVAVDASGVRPQFIRHASSMGPERDGSVEIVLADDIASFGKWISPALPVRGGSTYRIRIWQRADGVTHPDMQAPTIVNWRGDAAPPWSRSWSAPAVDRGRDATQGSPEILDRVYLRAIAPPEPTREIEGWRLLELVRRAPSQATAVEIEGWLRFAPRGRVRYAAAMIEELPALPPRVVTLGTARVTPPSGSTIEENRQLLARMVKAAAKEGADIVCLPENGLFSGTGLSSAEAAEPLDGPTVDLLQRVAADQRIWVVAQLPEQSGYHLHNTAVLLDRQGQIAARYRKMHLTIGEWERGVVPGDGPIVADTEIGRLGMLICFDLHFPEASRLTALAGADVIFGPTVGDRWPERRDAVTRAHALTNGVFVVTSLVSHPSDIVDPEGRRLAQAAEPNSVAVATVDLDYKATEAGRMIGPDNGLAPNSYWPTLRTDLFGARRL